MVMERMRRYMKAPECVCKTPRSVFALRWQSKHWHTTIKNYLDSCLAKSDARISEEVQSLLTEALRLEEMQNDSL